MQKITTHLWFDKEATEAAQFYTSIFKNSKIKNTQTLHNTPSASVEIVTIELLGGIHSDQRRPTLQIQRSDIVHGALRYAGRNRLLLGKALGGPTIGAVRLAKR